MYCHDCRNELPPDLPESVEKYLITMKAMIGDPCYCATVKEALVDYYCRYVQDGEEDDNHG